MRSAAGGQKALTIRLLGELAVVRGGEALELPASKKARALLGYLVATGRSHMRERLCELLWDGPDDPRAQLRWSLWKLRPRDHPSRVPGSWSLCASIAMFSSISRRPVPAGRTGSTKR